MIDAPSLVRDAAPATRSGPPPYLLYLTVLPVYRQACMTELLRLADGEVELCSGPYQLDPSVSTGIDRALYTPLRRVRIAGRLLLHLGRWRPALAAGTTIVDLNPRCLTAWVVLVGRRLLGRRTLVWGHLHPRKGADSPTARLRRTLRRLADGTVLYGFDSIAPAERELPGQPLWVAANALYPRARLVVDRSRPRTDVLYVGRLVASKKVDLLLRAWALSAARHRGSTLLVVGDGTERGALEALSGELELGASVRFCGAVNDVDRLTELYAGAVCATSPGYAGLSLTQSLGFGVPVVVADDEPHAPEIELAAVPQAVRFFGHDSAAAMAAAIDAEVAAADEVDRDRLCAAVAEHYAAENMARALWNALRGVAPQGGAGVRGGA